jgi:hypothetical protein
MFTLLALTRNVWDWPSPVPEICMSTVPPPPPDIALSELLLPLEVPADCEVEVCDPHPTAAEIAIITRPRHRPTDHINLVLSISKLPPQPSRIDRHWITWPDMSLA